MFFESGCDTFFKNGQFEDTSQCSIEPTYSLSLCMAVGLSVLAYYIVFQKNNK